MMCNHPNLDLISIPMHTQNLVKFYQFVLKILSGNEIMMDGQTDSKMTDNPNPV